MQLPSLKIQPACNPAYLIPAARSWLTLAGLLITLALSACASTPTKGNWPLSMPQRSIFVDAYERQRSNNTNANSLANHLMWVKRFYNGSILYPLGWNRMTEILLGTVENESVENELSDRMRELGIIICIEWAQDNDKRKIDSAAIAVWGNALRTAAELDQQLTFVSRVEQDVADLLNGSLNVQEIKRERYYPPEDYDNF